MVSEIANPGQTRAIIQKFGIRANKKLGQNFLIEPKIIEKILQASDIQKKDLVLEIGPGLGSLTAGLAQAAGKVCAVEIDKYLLPALRENLSGFTNVRIVNDDILQLNVAGLINELRNEMELEGVGPGLVKVVANLPYYITTPIIMKLLEEKPGIHQMTFMVQKEVGDRITAAPGSRIYGALSIAVQYYCKAERILHVPPHCFMPQPEVDSEVILLKVLDKPSVTVQDPELFFRLVKSAFAQRRKTLVNALYNSGLFNLDKMQIEEILMQCGINGNQRGETLSVLQYGKLADAIFEKRNK